MKIRSDKSTHQTTRKIFFVFDSEEIAFFITTCNAVSRSYTAKAISAFRETKENYR